MGKAMAIPTSAVRTSPLESAVAGPSWRGEGAGGAPSVTLMEIGPYDKVLVLGPGAAQAVSALLEHELPAQTVQTATVSRRTVEVWALGPGETLLLFEAAEAPGDGTTADVAGQIGEEDVSVIDVGSAWTVLALTGSEAPSVLAELLTVDVDPRSLAPGGIVQGPLGGVRSIVARRDTNTDPGYAILVARDYALYCWDALIEIGAAHGLAAGALHGRAPAGASKTTR